jgi:hypothetical protein
MGLMLAVGVPPGFGLLRRSDLAAIKSAVLYGDTAIVVMHLSTHMTTGLLIGVPTDERAAFLLRSTSDSVVEKAGYPIDAARRYALTKGLAAMVDDFQVMVQSKQVRLELIVEEDVYSSIYLRDGEPALLVRINPGMEQYAARLAELLVQNPHLNLILSTSDLSDRPLPRSRSTAMNHTHLGIELLSRLPGFESAPLSEIIDIREELSGSLVRFRAAMVELAEHSEDEVGAIESMWLAVVEPALLELDEAVGQNRYLRRLTERLLTPADGLSSLAGVTVGISTLHGVPESLAAGASVALPALRAGWDRRMSRERMKQHRLLFLYDLRNCLNR